MRKIFILTKILYISTSFAQDGKVGINTTSPSETLEVVGTVKIKELPQNNQGNIYDGKPQKDTPFKATRTVVANDSGVLGYIEGTPQDVDTNTTYTPGEGIIINDDNVISRSGLEAIYRKDGKRGWRLIGVNPEYHDEIGESAIDLTENNFLRRRNPNAPISFKTNTPQFEGWEVPEIAPVKPGAVGEYSIAIGPLNHSAGIVGTTIGLKNYAGAGGFTFGYSNTAVRSSHSIGQSNYSSGNSLSFGIRNISLSAGLSIGIENKSNSSFSFGEQNEATNYGFAIGRSNKVDKSFAIGYSSEATNRAIALGRNIKANTYGQVVVGFYNFNTDDGSNDLPNFGVLPRNDREVFVVGSGTASYGQTKEDRQNAFIVLRNGKTGIGVAKRKPTEMLEVAGAVKIDNGGYDNISDGATTPEPNGGAGTMVFHNGHFYGWNGTMWKQLDN